MPKPYTRRRRFTPHVTRWKRAADGRYRLTYECLEPRLVLYSVTGYQWVDNNVSVSLLPDGTSTEGYQSTLFAQLDAIAPTQTWNREFARALQTWASVSPLNFHFVADDGSRSGISGSTQGNSRFGDIRLGSHPLSGFVAFTYFPVNWSTLGGDITLNPNTTFHVGSHLDLYSVLLHEAGHALGLDHSGSGTVMNSFITGVYGGLAADDVAGIQAIYGARQHDAFDAATTNDDAMSASLLGLDASGAASITADLTTSGDVDYYQVTVPGDSDGTLEVSLDARGKSLLAPKLSVYDAAGNLVAVADAGADYGSIATVSLNGLSRGATYTLVADGTTDDVFGIGAYQFDVRFGIGTPNPAAEPANVSGRYVFYNNSFFDGWDPAAGTSDNAAIAIDKAALLPGETANFANYTSYDRGINGIIIDVANLANPASLTAADFTFRAGNNDLPSSWEMARAPKNDISADVRPGDGVGGTDRITILWDDYQEDTNGNPIAGIGQEWLQVTLKATANTGLAVDDVFYFGNAIGESGNGVPPPGVAQGDGSTTVGVTDMLNARNNSKNFLVGFAKVGDPNDFNKDGNVGVTDFLIARNNPANFLNDLPLLAAPVSSSLQVAGATLRLEEKSLDAAQLVANSEAGLSAGALSVGVISGRRPTETSLVAPSAMATAGRLADDASGDRTSSTLRAGFEAATPGDFHAAGTIPRDGLATGETDVLDSLFADGEGLDLLSFWLD